MSWLAVRFHAPVVTARKSPPLIPILRGVQENGAPQEKVAITTVERNGSGRPLDVTVAKARLEPGEVALSIPENLVVTLSRVFEDESLGRQPCHVQYDRWGPPLPADNATVVAHISCATVAGACFVADARQVARCTWRPWQSWTACNRQ